MSGPRTEDTVAAGFADEFREFVAGTLADAPAPGPDTVYDDDHPLWEKFRAAGLANWWLPARLGGAGVPLRASVDLMAQLAYHDPGFAFTAMLPILGSRMLEFYGTAEVAQRYLGEMARTGTFCAALGSEFAAGSELAQTATTFRREGDRLVVNGEKAFSTNLAFGRFCLALARNEDDHRDFSVVLVPAGTSGFVPGPRWPMSGLHGTGTYPATFTDCVVPAVNELTGNGLRVLEVGLNGSRILMAAISIGIARRARDLSMEYATSKRLGGRPLTQNAVFAARMGQTEMELESLKSVCWRAADEYDAIYARPDAAAVFHGQGVLKSAVMAKMHCGQTGWRIVSAASEGFGGLGYTEAHPVQRLLRDMRHISIVEGGDDVLRELTYGRYVRHAARRG
ncbi:acyl-CoA dehydrogenase [Streptomyces sp. 8K308]|uniref:acyl-CoA dehydrogenase family protein n=1 Tax=Streptomyces sp. 8K308 TaxID=2530388 RepID=UPI001049560C|nr:acyl-CoA dehydrogenase family protein [Streptomyces sp. 8K308]TDC24556.1 acyl-CoA dehydrogenase [Streptomyces sp. 8K308]